MSELVLCHKRRVFVTSEELTTAIQMYAKRMISIEFGVVIKAFEEEMSQATEEE